ncbi:MAG TPA: DNA methyltransferase, partial [Flavipsychrobacter sp.]|nr:DNA methyltransferase [Flavipsychrobacter sp.]
EASKMSAEEWNTFFAGHWNFAGARQTNHIAMFPEELPRRLIKMFSFQGENVLDPFGGSGTTTLAAKNLGRNSATFEINPDFIPILKEKIGVAQSDLEGTTYQFITSEEQPANFEKQILSLPYIFNDPHKLDKKIDIKKLQFGSRLDKDGNTKREEFFTVKEVISPELIRLSNDLTIKLLGIKTDEKINGKATEFLQGKTKGKRVFLKYDAVKYDSDNNLLCYLYLENKTFLNAHLIKHGLAQVDNDIEFKYKTKFLNLLQQVNG